VRRNLQGLLLVEVGGAAMYLAMSGRYLTFLKPGLRLPIAAAGLIQMVLGTWTIWPALVAYVNDPADDPADDPATDDPVGARAPIDRHPDAGDDDQHHGPSVGWLLALPLLALALVAPPPLGAAAARRDVGRAAPPPAGVSFPPLPHPTDGSIEMAVSAFVARANYDRDQSLAGATIRMTGFVVRDPGLAEGYLLTRFSLVCCAADAFASQVEVRIPNTPPPPDDTWVMVVGKWIPPGAQDRAQIERPPAFTAQSQTVIEAPQDPYD
jgi:uncharacterized repeat protein (TIGR03943 family)